MGFAERTMHRASCGLRRSTFAVATGHMRLRPLRIADESPFSPLPKLRTSGPRDVGRSPGCQPSADIWQRKSPHVRSARATSRLDHKLKVTDRLRAAWRLETPTVHVTTAYIPIRRARGEGCDGIHVLSYPVPSQPHPISIPPPHVGDTYHLADNTTTCSIPRSE